VPELAKLGMRLLWVPGLAAACALGGCRRDATRSDDARQASSFGRGDVVVVERTAAEFFEGRVLGVTDNSLKVQTTADGEPVVVARSDAYRVNDAKRETSPAAPAICNDAPAHWVACRVSAKDGAETRARLRSGDEVTLASEHVIRPSAVTALNIRKIFEVAEARRRFGEAAATAGDPRRPPGWLPEIHERVIARRGQQWFTAHVASLTEEGGARVLFEGSDRPEAVGASSVVPVPPHPRTVARGDFALARPASAAEPWLRVRVEAIGPEEAIGVGEDGERRRFETRQLIPLVPDLGH
jgi:hypothetical protein